MRRYLPPSAVNGPVWLGVYTKAMMINRNSTILAIFSAAAACAAGPSLVHAQQGYPVPPGSVYSAPPGPYVPGGYVVDERRRPGTQPDFDDLEDDEPNAPGTTALSPP